MAAVPLRLPSRKSLDYSRNRKLCGLSSALLVASLCVLLLSSLFFLDMEILYRKTGIPSTPQSPGIGALAQGLVVESVTDARVDGVAGALEVPAEEAEPTREPTLSDAETEPAVSDVVVEPIVADSELEPAVSMAEKPTTAEEDPAAYITKKVTKAEEEPAVSIAKKVTSAEEDPAVTKAEKGYDAEAVTAAEEDPAAVSEAEAVTVAAEEEAGEENEQHATRIGVRRALKGCDISQGRWVYDNASHPLYRSKNCPFADPGFRCEENGRPDKEFMFYRWQPHGCDLPRFNATDILERLRGQRFVFVGDSLGRNNWESMLCMLAEGVSDKSRIYEVNGEPITKHTGQLIYRFEDYNCTVEYYRDPFLVPQARPPKHSPKNVTYTLVVDRVSLSTKMWINADIIIFNAGHWWSEHKIFRQGMKFQEFEEIQEYDLQTGFKKSLETWATYLKKHLDSKKTEFFWISYPIAHFRGGTWNRGGRCDQETRPLTEEEAEKEWQTPWMNQVVLDSFISKLEPIRQAVTYLDITTSTNYRSDGHGALYNWDTKKFGQKPRNTQDCSHFCLPGVPDTWNELIFGSLFAKGEHPWALATPH